MELRITIPKEFEEHFNFDHFKDSLGRIAFDLTEYIKLQETNPDVIPLSGNYEQELAYALPKIFETAKIVSEPMQVYLEPIKVMNENPR